MRVPAMFSPGTRARGIIVIICIIIIGTIIIVISLCQVVTLHVLVSFCCHRLIGVLFSSVVIEDDRIDDVLKGMTDKSSPGV